MALTKIDDRGLKTPIDLLDNEKIRFGTGNDLEISHNGTHSFLENSTNGLYLRSDEILLQTDTGNEGYIVALLNGAVDIHYDGVKKFETLSNGIKVTGRVQVSDFIETFTNDTDLKINSAGSSGQIKFYINGSEKAKLDSNGNFQINNDSGKITVGTGSDLQIYHNGTNSSIKNLTGHLILQSDSFKVTNNGDTESIIRGTANGNVELYYDNSKKLETETTGAKVTGMLGVNVTPDTSASSTYALQIKGSTQCYMSIGNDTTGVGISNGLIIGNDATDVYIYNRENTPIVFGVNGVNKFIMKTGGQFQIIDGDLQLASGHGIDFSATADASGHSSSLFNDYEEGTWTPNIKSNNSAVSWASGFSSAGVYTKIGRMVYAQFNITGTLSQSYDSANQVISALPFTSAATNQVGVGLVQDVSGISYPGDYGDIYGRVNASVTECQLLVKKTDGSTHSGNPNFTTSLLVLRGMVIYNV